MKHKYSVYISWSKDDEAFIAQVIELPGCVADGASQEEALNNVDATIDEWIETAKELGREIPEPIDHRSFEEGAEAFNRQLEQHVRREVETAVQRVLQDLARSQQGPLLMSGRVLVGANDPSEWWKRAEDQSVKHA
jgi:predicted RNase H-like HicB family nuclease